MRNPFSHINVFLRVRSTRKTGNICVTKKFSEQEYISSTMFTVSSCSNLTNYHNLRFCSRKMPHSLNLLNSPYYICLKYTTTPLLYHILAFQPFSIISNIPSQLRFPNFWSSDLSHSLIFF